MIKCFGSAPLILLASLAACAGPGRVAPDSPVGQGRGHLSADRFAEARDAFRQGLAANPGDPNALLGLGAAFEGLDQLDSAQAVYDRLGGMELPGRVQRQLRARQELLAQRELRILARRAIANEQQLARQTPPGNTLAVFPFRYTGRKEDVKPLERGLAQIFVTDLGQVRALRLLERQRVQFLLEEIQLGETGRVDPSSAARSGRLLQAARIVQGSMSDVAGTDRLQLDVNVVSTTTTEITATGTATDRLQQLFDIEKDVLFQLLDRLNVQVTLAERELLAERPTANLQAFLAFSRGLEAEDRGDYARAAAEYRAAARIDPSFRQAASRSQSAVSMDAASQTTVSSVAQLMEPPPVPRKFIADNLNQVIPSTIQVSDQNEVDTGGQDGEVGGGVTTGTESPPPAGRNPGGDVADNPGLSFDRIGTLIIIVRRP